MRKLFLLFNLMLFFTFLGNILLAQSFTESLSGDFVFENMQTANTSFSDIDGDGDQDMLMTAINLFDDNKLTKLYLNDGLGNFTEREDIPFPNLNLSTAAFADVDNDGDEDLLLIGKENEENPITRLYLNDGTGNFTLKENPAFTGVSNGEIAFADVDGDGDLDVLLTGRGVSFARLTKLYLNDGTGNFTERMDTPFVGVEVSAVDFADIDGDSDQDVIIAGSGLENGDFFITTDLFVNDGAGSFTKIEETPFTAIHRGAVGFSDIDDDGDQDVLITGEGEGRSYNAELFLNDGMGNFTLSEGMPFTKVIASTLVFFDVDQDGDDDIVIEGANQVDAPIVQIYLNDGAGNFTAIRANFKTGARGNTLTIADLDMDTDMDIVIGAYDRENNMNILRFYFYLNDLISPASPTNDNLCDAIPIEIGEDCSKDRQINLANATIETSEPIVDPSCTDGDTTLTSTVWFSFIAPAEEIYILAEADDKSNSALAYQMQLFRLNEACNDLNNLEFVACNTPPTNILESPAILTTLTAGETYYVQISGRRFPGLGPFESTGCLTINTITAPANDNVCNAIALEVDAEPQVFSNLGASAEDEEADIAPPPSSNPFGFEPDGWSLNDNVLDNSVWFTFTTGAEGGSYNVDLNSSFGLAGNFNTQVAIYEASDCNDFSTFNLIGAADNGIPPGGGLISASPNLDLFCLEGNTTYHIVVDGGNTFFFRPIASQGIFSIQVQKKELEPLEARFLIEGPSCEGDENGSILVTGLGGAGEYEYSWSTGDSINRFIENFAAGTYVVTITDQCGVQKVENVEVPATSRDGLGLAVNINGAACEGESLELDALTFGGLPIEEQRVFVQTSLSRTALALTKMKLENTTSKETVAADQTILFLQFEFVEDQLYATDRDGNFYSINTENGTSQLIDTLKVGFITGLSYVPSTATLYCINSDGKIYELNPTSASLNEVLDLSISVSKGAIDLEGNIILLGVDGNWYTSSFSTGTLNNIGFFGANTLPVTALEVDPNTGKVYYSVSRVLAQGAFDQAWQAITELNITNGESVRVLNSFSSRFSALSIRASEIAPYEYEWMPAESFDDPTLASQTPILEETTTFIVSATDACETVTDEFIVEALPSVEVTIDTSILKGETYNDIVIETDTTIMETIATETSCEIRTVNIMVITSSTVQTWAENAIQISPNPTSSILNVSTLGIEERAVELRIVDVHGRTLWQQTRQQLQEEIDVSEFRSGLYFLEIRTEEKVAVRQFVKL